MKFSTWNPAPTGTIIHRDAYDGQVGKTIPITVRDGEVMFEATVTAVEVTDDPHGVAMTFEADDNPMWMLALGDAYTIEHDDVD